jgi:subtilisin-like proprotein convertase family protein
LSCGLTAQPIEQAASSPNLDWHARDQIRLLLEEKLSRTPAQKKVDSQLLYSARQRRKGTVGFGLNALKPAVRFEADGRVLVDLRANTSPALIAFIKSSGGLVVNSFRTYSSVRALVPLELVEVLAQRPDVRSVRPAARARTNEGLTYQGGDIAHRAAEARQFFFADGTGVKIGVLSDSIDGLADAQASGALPAVTILPGQAGTGTGEGTAMLEIVHALAPGSPLYFATAFNSEESFAQNIRDLQAAGCRIIIDDVSYFDESPFQDGVIARAVNDVSAAGALYFSSVGNSGGLDRASSGTWEGDFKDAGAATIGQGGRIHDFGGVDYNTVIAGGNFERLDLTWSDPLGHSANDYDVYVLDSSGNIVSSSTSNQDGTSDPYEGIASLSVGDRIVILKYSGEDRFLHLSTGRGRLAIATAGATYGHNASGASNAFCVAATRVSSPPAPFQGGAANPVETFSSDGPRHIFFKPDGSPITPGDSSSAGGQVLKKPDLTAADGIYMTLPGFSYFLGTSAAAPHLGAIAALLWSYNPFLTPAAVRSLLTSTALPIGNAGFDRNSGAGVAMAYPALAAAPATLLHAVQLQDANHNGELDANECADVVVTLRNLTGQALSGVTAVLSSSTPEVFVDPTLRVFPDLQPNDSATSNIPFHISTGPGYVCGSNAVFLLEVRSANQGSFAQPFRLNSPVSGAGNTNSFASTNGPMAVPDLGTIESAIQVSGIGLPLAQVRVGVYITHTYDQDLRISLVSPDNTEVVLSANNGLSGHNYGASCDNATWFWDNATGSIDLGAAPFLGAFMPDQPLSTFEGKAGSAVNGSWKLRVEDQAPQDTGTLQCWSLELIPIGCLDGGGQCLSPPVFAQDLSNQVTTNGSKVQLAVIANGTGPLAYQWYFNATNALPGETNATLQLTHVSLAQAGSYQVVVTNLYGTAISALARLVVVVPATILSNPASQIATNGATVTWSVLAEGSPPLSYQWYFNSTNVLADQTNSILVLSNVSPAQSGSYEVVVTNIFGGVTSAPANLLVRLIPHILCSPDTNVTLGSPWDFSAPTYSDTNLILVVLGTTTNSLCGQSYSATRQWLVSTTNGYQVTCSQTVQVLDRTAPVLSCAPAKTNVYGTTWSFDLPVARDAGTVEALVYDNWTNNSNQSLDLGLVEVGNQVTLGGSERYPSRLAIEYWGTNASQSGFAGAVTAQVRFYHNDGPALPSGEATPGTVFYDSGPLGISATAKGSLVLQEFDLSAAVPVAGALPPSFTWTVRFSGLGSQDAAGLKLYGPPVVGQVAASSWVSGPSGWKLQAGQSFGAQLAALSRGTTLSVVSTVTNLQCARGFTATRTWQAMDACNNASSCSQTVTVVDGSAPVVVSQPQDQSALVGQTVSLSVGVSSCSPTAYQWYFDDTNALPGETNATLVLGNLGAGQSGTYAVVITNAYGSATSAPATILVQVPALIVADPPNQVATNGDNVHWRVLAKGSAPLFYQWYFNVTNALDQQTNATLDLTNVSLAQAGIYQVVVTNIYGSDTSAPAHLTIVVPPTIVTNPADQVATNGDTVTWRVRAQGTDPLSYQWYFDATSLGLATNSTLVLNNVSPAQAGSYAVVVANAYGSVTSAPANLKIIIVPRVVCSPDVTVPLGSPWGFTPPVYSDTNLTLVVLGTSTNILCGQSYSATRQWLVSDTNGYAVNCSQTVQVLDTAAPVLSCPRDKTNLYGNTWSFDLPAARAAGAVEATVYDNWTNNLNQSLDPGLAEVGNQVTLDGSERYPSRLAIEYWGTNASQSAFSGMVTAQVRFYRNDGPVLSTGVATPGTVFYDSGPLAISATAKGSLVLQEFDLSAAVAVAGALPSNFTWTVRFSGLGSQDAAGLKLYGPPVVGQVVASSWVSGPSGWKLQTGQSFGAQLAALSRGTTLSVVSTVTNLQCARGFTATRTWQAMDACNNASSCSQTVTVVDQSAPVVVSQPQDQSAAVGQTVSLSVGVSSCPPTGYQWYFNQTNVLAQGRSATLVLTNVSTAQAGRYEVVVTNAYGSITSAPANLSISAGQAPAITSEPQSLTVLQGQPVLFSVTAIGAAPVSYQWMANCTRPISGATSPTLRLKSAGAADSGSYCVTVSNAFGSILSQPAVLRVLIPPKLLSVFQTQNGASLTFSTSTNLLYTVYSSANLQVTDWSLLPNAFQQLGTGTPMTVQDPGASGSQRFYRIVVE